MKLNDEMEALREEIRAANAKLDALRAAMVMLTRALLTAPEARGSFGRELEARADNARIASLGANAGDQVVLVAQADEYDRLANMVRPLVNDIAA